MQPCVRRLAFLRDPGARNWERRGTRASLGLVAHRLTELVLEGRAPVSGRRPWLEARWLELLHAQHEKLAAEWSGSEVPPVDAWPGVTATRVRLLRTLESVDVPDSIGHESMQDAQPAKWEGLSRPKRAPSLPWVERTLFDPRTRLAGRPDRVEERAGIIRLIDFKSGVRQGEADERQARQLLFYAHLVRSTLGRLPDEVLIIDVRGAERHVAVSEERVDDIVAHAVSAVERFRTMAEDGRFAGAAAPEVCHWCPFKVMCADYWDARDPGWPSIDVRGVVAGQTEDSVIVQRTQPEGSSSVRLIGLPGHGVAIGDEVVAVDLARAGAGAARLRWWSRVRH